MIFQLVKKNLSFVGVSKQQTICSFYGKLFISCLIFSTNAISRVKFLLNENISFEEYIQSFNLMSFSVTCTLLYMILILKMEKAFELIDMVEQLIILLNENQSECDVLKSYFIYALL